MDIKANSLYAQMQSMSLEAMGNRQPSIEGGVTPANNSTSDFGSLLKDAVNKVNDIQQTAGRERTAFELGDPDVTLSQTMVSAAKAGVAFEATVQIRNKFVESYKEIMNMSV